MASSCVKLKLKCPSGTSSSSSVKWSNEKTSTTSNSPSSKIHIKSKSTSTALNKPKIIYKKKITMSLSSSSLSSLSLSHSFSLFTPPSILTPSLITKVHLMISILQLNLSLNPIIFWLIFICPCPPLSGQITKAIYIKCSPFLWALFHSFTVCYRTLPALNAGTCIQSLQQTIKVFTQHLNSE